VHWLSHTHDLSYADNYLIIIITAANHIVNHNSPWCSINRSMIGILGTKKHDTFKQPNKLNFISLTTLITLNSLITIYIRVTFNSIQLKIAFTAYLNGEWLREDCSSILKHSKIPINKARKSY